MVLFTHCLELVAQIKHTNDSEEKILLAEKLVTLLRQSKLPGTEGSFPLTAESLNTLFN